VKAFDEEVIWDREIKLIEWHSRRSVIMTNTPNTVTSRTFAGLNITTVKTTINFEVSISVRGKGFSFGLRY
jgi:hypothetical protein